MDRPVTTVRDLAAACRGRRRALGLSQTVLASRAGVSRQWVSEFETGKPTAELGLVLRLLDALGLRLSVDDGTESVRRGATGKPRVDLDAILDEYRTK